MLTDNIKALKYHSEKRPGKIEISATKSLSTSYELSLAYTPGVAAPCAAITDDPNNAYKYTAKGNLVAVVTNGTAVLGLGNTGSLAAKPVMEGKGVLFKKFADIDVFDIEIDENDPKKIVDVITAISPTFGGINLEDIKAPECFYIEQELSKRLPIPVFHDDQHGTAIIAGAALLNALEIVNKPIEAVRFAIAGAGAAAIACAHFFVSLGADINKMFLSDIDGVLHSDRKKNIFNCHKPFLKKTDKRTLKDIMHGADVFLGLSAGNIVNKKMLLSMNKSPIIFAMANPTPEISYEEAKATRPDAIVATGRSDYPNQVNNVLGFPFIFRGALDTRAERINEEMKIAASRAIANLAKEQIPESVRNAYGKKNFKFGPEYILPKPFDPRVLGAVAPAVAKAATDTKVARSPIEDIRSYRDSLARRINPARGALDLIYEEARKSNTKIVFAEGDNERVLLAADTLIKEEICTPILLGSRDKIHEKIKELNLNLKAVRIIDPTIADDRDDKASLYFSLRGRKGVTLEEARHRFRSRLYYGAMMVRVKEADGLILGITRSYPNAVRPILECIGTADKKRALAMYVMAFKDDIKFFADTALTISPTEHELATIAIQTADRVKRDFNTTPHIAMLSFSNFGSVNHESTLRAKKAVDIVKRLRPDLNIDGEMQADVALDEHKRRDHFPFSTLMQNANIFIFTNLDAANISYKLLAKLGNCEAIGPILLGIKGAANVCQLHATPANIVHMSAITAVSAKNQEKIHERFC